MDTAASFKDKGNDAFKKGEYGDAASFYSSAIGLDPSNALYFLNRSMANLKLERWSQAEEDATSSLELGGQNHKALYRRSVARMEQGKLFDARDDISAFRKLGGAEATICDVLAKISKAESVTVQATSDTAKLAETGSSPSLVSSAVMSTPTGQSQKGYNIADAGVKGLGAFALHQFRRGDLILSERPLVTNENSSIETAVNALSPADKEKFFSLMNAHSGASHPALRSAIDGISWTNGIAIDDDAKGIFLDASRFNHSCSPNARYSWNRNIRRLTIHALCEIAAGEEICVSYLASRNVYGSTRATRQRQLARFAFTCTCPSCSLKGPDAAKSDQRRTEVASIWEKVPYYPPSRTGLRLSEIARAIHLLQAESYWADYDDFTNDAAAICAFHSDWASAKYWAQLTWETRVAEFGRDSPRAAEVKGYFLNTRALPMAGMGPRQKFTVRL